MQGIGVCDSFGCCVLTHEMLLGHVLAAGSLPECMVAGSVGACSGAGVDPRSRCSQCMLPADLRPSPTCGSHCIMHA